MQRPASEATQATEVGCRNRNQARPLPPHVAQCPGAGVPLQPMVSGGPEWWVLGPAARCRAITRHGAISCPASSLLAPQFLLYLSKMNRDEVK